MERLRVLLAAALAAASLASPAAAADGTSPAAAIPGTTPGDRRLDDGSLAGLLAEAGDASDRSRILRQLGEAEISCHSLTRFGASDDPAVREQAVRTMDQGGCAAIEYYRPYMRDPHPWVTDALVAAFERLRIGEAVPFLIDHLSDPRIILSGSGSWTIGERAHRALRAVSCQSLHFDLEGSAQERARAAARWASWYADHGGEPRKRWLEEGLARAWEYLDRDGGRLRLEGLELLLLIGEPTAPEVRAAFRRAPEELAASLTCTPAEPPRVTEEVPCRFEVVNMSGRWIALIPGELDVVLHGEWVPDQTAGAKDVGPRPPSSGGSDFAAEMAQWIGRIVDLAPGERLGRSVVVGPVPGAGRYEVRAVLSDLSARMVDAGGGAADGRALKAVTVVHFNQ